MSKRNYKECHAEVIDLPFQSWSWDCTSNELTFDGNQDSIFNVYLNQIDRYTMGWSRFLPANEASALEDHIICLLKKEDRFHVQLDIVPNPGEERTLILHGIVTRRDTNGNPLFVHGIARPEIPQLKANSSQGVSFEERRHLENLLIRAQRFEGIGKLAGGIAHDLNNLLAPIRMATELLARKLKDASLSRYIEIIQSSTDRARSVTQQILAFSRGSEDEQIKFIYVNDVITDLEKMLLETFPKRIELDFDYGNDIPMVRMDPNHLHQSLLNLLINARDAIQETGKISVVTKNQYINVKIAIGGRYFKPGNYICIEISDTGCGISTANCERIFDPFFTTKDKTKGTGLGLATAYGIIAHAGGFIDVESKEGKGTKFTIFLPEPEDIYTNDSSETPMIFDPLTDRSILVVDDEINVLQTLTHPLETWGMKVSPFDNPSEALRKVESGGLQFDFALIDIHMPGLSGDDLIKRLLELNSIRKIVIITGDVEYSESKNLPNKIQIIHKPFKLSELQKAFSAPQPPSKSPSK